MAELITKALRGDVSLVSYYRMEGNSNDYKGANNGTDTGISYSTANGKYGQGAGFTSASSSKIVIGTTGIPTGAATRTWCGWIYKTTSSVDVMMGSSDGTSAGTFGIFINNLRITAWGGGSDTDTGLDISLNAWHFIATTYDGTNVKVYLNDRPAFSVAKTLTTSASNAGFGSNIGALANFLTGNLDDMAIFSRELSRGELNQLYLAGVPKYQGGRPYPFQPGRTR